ncbi:hypothetical protein AB0J72_20280 [Dactylosporangium sp. NPDC049742]|uniref:hypothetical protein n=1 Tax=Dactylosporangium sp. NPDC049742 TaxID=3154737 RepID=UPI00343EC035
MHDPVDSFPDADGGDEKKRTWGGNVMFTNRRFIGRLFLAAATAIALVNTIAAPVATAFEPWH